MADIVSKEIMINVGMNETRVAIVEEGTLVEMHIERPENERTIGNIYTGFVDNVIPGINSIFVDIGEKLNGFVHMDEFIKNIIPDDFIIGDYVFTDIDEEISEIEKNTDKRDLKKGDKVLVQVVKEQISTKGPRITSQITIPGRYVVLMPNYYGVRISKKISRVNERKRLRKLITGLIPEDFGIIVRTAAENKDAEVFVRDIISTYNIWKKVIADFKKSETPKLLYKDYDVSASIVRDLFNDDVKRMLIDSKDMFSSVKDYVRSMAPDLLDRVEYYGGDEPIFDKFYNINKDFLISLSREVFMRRGGSIVIEHTEAMVSIDVNSKRYIKNKPQEENSLTINLNAAREIARQLRLRDIGGLVVIDFIDMSEQYNRDRIFNELRNSFRRDPAKISIEPVSRFGLVEMTRQRLKPSIVQTIYEKCPICAGKGIVRSKETIATMIDRWIKNFKYAVHGQEVDLHINIKLQEFLTRFDNNFITATMLKHWVRINVITDNSLNEHSFRFCYPGTQEEVKVENRETD
ncbi:MAG: Rne/Rng family ribonuclease [Candidatus Delongbacteria bacterium]|nr:Rne/Rng family ribonuclease [Candidatus Delongbacteria bacterium]MBN2836122.1 Rne/Rng family ribonuclease [Candidatus Delongbacteria bacterium]